MQIIQGAFLEEDELACALSPPQFVQLKRTCQHVVRGIQRYRVGFRTPFRHAIVVLHATVR